MTCRTFSRIYYRTPRTSSPTIGIINNFNLEDINAADISETNEDIVGKLYLIRYTFEYKEEEGEPSATGIKHL